MERIVFLLTYLLGLTPLRSYASFKRFSPTADEDRDKDTQAMLDRSRQIASLYSLPEGSDLQEITFQTLAHPLTSEKQRNVITAVGRRFFVFLYPSDGLLIKGMISFVPNPEDQSLLMVLRGGNQKLGIMNPGGQLLSLGKYTVITTLYRGGICEGIDEFGGADVNDVKNLFDYIPELEKRLQHQFLNHKRYILGASRGGMQMFLTLSRFPELKFEKAISLSGLLDLETCIAERPDMKKMFIENFGYIEGVNEGAWIARRDPITAIEKLDPELPIIIMQGSADIRVGLQEGYRMVEKLYALGKTVHYVEVDHANHCLHDREDLAELIQYYLQNDL